MAKKETHTKEGRAVQEVAKIIQQTFADFGVETEIVDAIAGLRFYHCYFRATKPVRMKAFSSFANDLKYALETDTIEIEAPVPGKKLVGVKVPIPGEFTALMWEDYRDRTEYSEATPLTVPIGTDEFGQDLFFDIARLPHLLVGGATGSGKSNFLMSTISYLADRNDPDVVRFILIDPTRVELTLYNKLPHLLTPVITDAKKAVLALKWCVKEMERRYDVLHASKCREIAEYHQKVYAPAKATWINMGAPESDRDELPEPMPYIVVAFDEIAELMAAYSRETEASLIPLTQMARAVGIHLIVSSQRPTADVITGLMKANIPSRFAFSVSSKIDSRNVLDTTGAEELRGPGNGLWRDVDSFEAVNIQTPFIGESEVIQLVKSWVAKKEQQEPDRIEFAEESIDADQFFESLSSDEYEEDLYEEAKEAVIKAGKVSTSWLQRKFRIGYSRSARLVDLLEERGVIGPQDGTNPREVLIEPEDAEE